MVVAQVLPEACRERYDDRIEDLRESRVSVAVRDMLGTHRVFVLGSHTSQVSEGRGVFGRGSPGASALAQRDRDGHTSRYLIDLAKSDMLD